MAVLVTTHYLDEAEHCHRVAIIQAGRLAALGTVAELKPIFAVAADLRGARRRGRWTRCRRSIAMPEVEKTSIFGTAVHAVLRSADADADDAGRRGCGPQGIEVTSCTRVVPSLEDVFLDVAEKGAAA